MKITTKMLSWAIAGALVLFRTTCRIRLHDDPRPAIRSAGSTYIYAVLHAHQISAAIGRERGTAAMVSRSDDGQLLVPGLKVLGIKPIRGSNKRHQGDKGGRTALSELITHVGNGHPAYLAVDGPRGPRNRVRKGIAVLSQETGAAVIVLVAIPSKRWVFRKAWDRMQIPQPFCRIDGYFGAPLHCDNGESVEHFRQRIENALNQLEREWDPQEAGAGKVVV